MSIPAAAAQARGSWRVYANPTTIRVHVLAILCAPDHVRLRAGEAASEAGTPALDVA